MELSDGEEEQVAAANEDDSIRALQQDLLSKAKYIQAYFLLKFGASNLRDAITDNDDDVVQEAFGILVDTLNMLRTNRDEGIQILMNCEEVISFTTLVEYVRQFRDQFVPIQARKQFSQIELFASLPVATYERTLNYAKSYVGTLQAYASPDTPVKIHSRDILRREKSRMIALLDAYPDEVCTHNMLDQLQQLHV